MREVVRHLIQSLERDRELILCQVVETRGSTPQKAGALMVVDPGGGQVGTLGGGCVENEVKQKAIRQLGASRGDAPVVRPRSRLRLGRRPDLRRQDGDRHRGPARDRAAATTSARSTACSRPGKGSPRPSSSIPSESRARPSAGDSSSVPTRRCRASWPAGPVPDGLAEQGRAARRAAEAGGAGGRRLAADAAQDPAGHRRRGARRAGRGRPRRPGRFRRLGRRRPQPSTPIPSGFPRPSGSSSARSRRCSRRSRSRPTPTP